MVAPVTSVRDFLERHGEFDYSFGHDSDCRTTLYIRGIRTADWDDVLVWRRGGKVIVAGADQTPYIEGHAALRGYVAKREHDGRIVSYWDSGRRVVADAVPVDCKIAVNQWATRHPEARVRLFMREDKRGTKRPLVRMPDGEEYPRYYWLVWTEERGVQKPMTTTAWRAFRGSLIRNGISFRQMFGGAELGFERKHTGVN
jgi:hypothetical protein|nr:MAG TPA: hypothetical protein [Caudoviricetes sp.]